MYRGAKVLTSLLLVLIIVINVVSPVLAETEQNDTYLSISNERLKMSVDKPKLSNMEDFTRKEQLLINRITKNPKLYLEYADIINDTEVLIYGTEDPTVKIGSTGGYIEVVTKKGDEIYVINGVEHRITFTYVEDNAITKNEIDLSDSKPFLEEESNDFQIYSGRWIETSYVAPPWRSVHSGWYNIHLENAVKTYTWAVLVMIATSIVNPLAGVVGGIVSLWVGSQYTNSSVAKVYKVFYEHETYPSLYKMESHHCYAVWEGEDKFLGIDRKYYEYSYN